jgi:hypothetical protein
MRPNVWFWAGVPVDLPPVRALRWLSELPCQAATVNASEVEVRERVDADLLPDLMELFASAWWATHRTNEEVSRMLAASDLVFAVVHRKSDRLVGFARVITDEVYLAVVLDVIVSPAVRGSGAGRDADRRDRRTPSPGRRAQRRACLPAGHDAVLPTMGIHR